MPLFKEVKGIVHEVIAREWLTSNNGKFGWSYRCTKQYSSADLHGVDIIGSKYNTTNYYQVKSSHTGARQFGERFYKGKPIKVIVVSDNNIYMLPTPKKQSKRDTILVANFA